ncbi:uncharacterized protein J3D65DRAFT_131532 [Phyllosticta citribraziliensis]|uniref:Uncharacterized protein n=1 Tax=Phyllosticta citribraziliensis TaxID=989973 RepID=A0ABR1L5Y6_9PEZI
MYMIQWMYTNNAVAPSGQKPLIFDIRLYAAAEFYQIRVLHNEMMRFVLHDVRDQLRRISDDVTLPKAVELIYSSTPESDRGLRDAIVAFCAKNYAYCARNKGFKKISVMEFWRDLCLGVKEDLYDKVHDPHNSDYSRRDAVMLRTFREYKCELCGVLFMVPEAAAKPENCVFCSEDEVEGFQRLGSSIVRRLPDSLHSFESEQAGHKYEPIINCAPPHIARLYPG